MKTGYIRFSDTNGIEVNLINSTVWLTAKEIADLFGVNISTVNKHLKEIFKDNFLKGNEVTKEYRYTCPKHGECICIYYNLEVITCLSFRIQSLYTKTFREWVFHAFSEFSQTDKKHDFMMVYNINTRKNSLKNLN